MPDATPEVQEQIRDAIADIEKDVVATDQQFASLYDPMLPMRRPMPVFGRAARAQFLTIGANPSADDIRCGNWQPDSDLAAQCLDYFHNPAVRPHPFFSDWETALSALTPCRFSYRENLAHLDLSPRPTRSVRAINKSDQDKKVFMAMLNYDSKYFFSVLAIVWPNLRGLFAAGTVTDDWYIDELLKRHGKSFGVRFQRPHVFPAKANSQRAHPKLYGVTFSGASKPLFFCPVGASADRPGDKERFYAQFSDNAEFLRPTFCPAAKAQESA